MPLPKLTRVKQTFDTTRLDEAYGAVAAGLKSPGLDRKIKPGARVAITAGSRGIQNLVRMTRAAVDTVKAMGGHPFIVPAMGSHGGATDEGQKTLLADLGISEGAMGCPVVSSVQVEEIGLTPSGHPVYFSKDALHADGVIAVNRVWCMASPCGSWPITTRRRMSRRRCSSRWRGRRPSCDGNLPWAAGCTGWRGVWRRMCGLHAKAGNNGRNAPCVTSHWPARRHPIWGCSGRSWMPR